MDPTSQSPPCGFCHCCCFPIGSDRFRTETPRPRKWWRSTVKTLMKAREWSEIVAGPRWKNFIRRFNRKGSGSGKRFGYDPLSYSLNFDSSGGSPDRDHLGLSAWFVPMPGSEKSVMVAAADEGK